MDSYYLRFTDDFKASVREIEQLKGRILHRLGPSSFVASLPEGVSAAKLKHSKAKQPRSLDEGEKMVVDSWKDRNVLRNEALSMAMPNNEGAVWGSSDLKAPGHHDPRESLSKSKRSSSTKNILKSTGIPTSLRLTGSVGVGIIIVSGYTWNRISGKLKHVSAAADGTVWGVNSSDTIYYRNGSTWTRVSGKLKQISVGSANHIWGVNSKDEIYCRTGNTWTRVSGSLKHVSVGSDGTVWGVNKKDEIYRRSGGSWVKISGKLKQISVGNTSTIWGVNSSNQIYRRSGSGWQQVAGSLKYVSVATDGTVWGVNKDDVIYRRNGNSWEKVGGKLKQISVASRNVNWGVNSSDQIYFGQDNPALTMTAGERSNVLSEVIEGLNFLTTEFPPGNISFHYDVHNVTVSATPGPNTRYSNPYDQYEADWRNAAMREMGYDASYDGVVDYVEKLKKRLRTDWAYVAFFTHYPLNHFAYAGGVRVVMDYANDGWGPANINRVFAHETCHIFGAADEYGGCSCGPSGEWNVANLNCVNCTTVQIPCLMNANTLDVCEWSAGQIGWSLWRPVSGKLKYVSVATDGTIWGVNSSDTIYRRVGGSWRQVSGKLKQISVGNATNIWGVNKDDYIYRRVGSAWQMIAGKLKHISVSSDGEVWGVNADDEIYHRTGSTFTKISGKLKQISVASGSQVWGVNKDNNIYQRIGNSWHQVSGKLKHVSVADDGSVWGVNPNDEIYRRINGNWVKIPGALSQISIGSEVLIWGVNKSDVIYRRELLT